MCVYVLGGGGVDPVSQFEAVSEADGIASANSFSKSILPSTLLARSPTDPLFIEEQGTVTQCLSGCREH